MSCSLIFEAPVKDELLDYVETGMTFAEANISPQIISWNRMILFYGTFSQCYSSPLPPTSLFAGPPGTGKTSISKALAHKLAIRLSDRFEYGQLVEINAHSLMSKFFSEVRAASTDLLRRMLISSKPCRVASWCPGCSARSESSWKNATRSWSC